MGEVRRVAVWAAPGIAHTAAHPPQIATRSAREAGLPMRGRGPLPERSEWEDSAWRCLIGG